MDLPHSAHSGSLSAYDEGDLGFPDGQLPSPMADSPSSTGFPDDMHSSLHGGMHGGGSNGMSLQGAQKPVGSMNNFVAKLYQLSSLVLSLWPTDLITLDKND